MKKIVMLAAVLSAISVVSADDYGSEEELVCHNGLYFGFGFDLCDSGDKNVFTYGDYPVEQYTEIDAASTRIGGSIILGYGKKLSSKSFYIGLEAGLDFHRNAVYFNGACYDSYYMRNFDIELKRGGVSPSLAFRIGHYDCDTGILTFIKVGASYVKTTEHYKAFDESTTAESSIEATHKMTSYLPTVALGIERAFTKKVSARLEAEYRFGKNKTKTYNVIRSVDENGNLDSENGTATPFSDIDRLSQKPAINIRALVCYNVWL
ncbi:MAG: hypothetical protein LBB29_01560 [Holosporaceae bacterium]|jgi:opacity protein-like surface antigen|nr:hypothetical protein [Holosporaceae bacterium]